MSTNILGTHMDYDDFSIFNTEVIGHVINGCKILKAEVLKHDLEGEYNESFVLILQRSENEEPFALCVENDLRKKGRNFISVAIGNLIKCEEGKENG